MTTTLPVCTVIAGPNGSGKSTIYDRLVLPGRFINADIIARTLNPARPEAASLLAGKATLTELANLLAARDSFVYETTLSSRQSIALMHTARKNGYEVRLVFVALNSPDLNVRRVANRVARGGHDIPEPVIRRRYDAVLRQLPEAIMSADACMVFDNSLPSGPRLLLQIRGTSIEQNALDSTDPFHYRLAEAVSPVVAMPPEALLHAAHQN